MTVDYCTALDSADKFRMSSKSQGFNLADKNVFWAYLRNLHNARGTILMPKESLLIQKYVRRMKGRKREIVNVQISPIAENLWPYLSSFYLLSEGIGSDLEHLLNPPE